MKVISPSDDLDKRLLRIEQHFDTLKYHLYQQNLLIQAVIDELRDFDPQTIQVDELSLALNKERKSLKALTNLSEKSYQGNNNYHEK
jgi:methionine synthase II (cobalamin-independent)